MKKHIKHPRTYGQKQRNDQYEKDFKRLGQFLKKKKRDGHEAV